MAQSLENQNSKEPVASQPPGINAATVFYKLATLAIIVIMLHYGAPVLIPFAIAILLTFILVPIMKQLDRLRLRRPASILIILVLGIALFGTFGWIAEREMAQMVESWPEYRECLRDKCRSLSYRYENFEKYQADISRTLSGEPQESNVSSTPDSNRSSIAIHVLPAPNSAIAFLAQYSGHFFTPVAEIVLVATILAFMLFNYEDLMHRMVMLVGDRHTRFAKESVGEATELISRCLFMQSLINLCFGAMAAFGLWLIHITVGGHAIVTTTVLAGFLCGICRFIPYIGVWIGASLPLLFTFAAYPSNTPFIFTLGMFVLLELITAQIIEPRWLGAAAGISPSGVLVSVVFWTWLWGPIGLLLSTPITLVLVMIGKHAPPLRPLYILLSFDVTYENAPTVTKHQKAD
jgi:predicted PurR-regulated permease PerM